MIRFSVTGVFTIRARSMVFCRGKMEGGKIQAGQHVTKPTGLPPVAAVEFAVLNTETKKEEPALGFRFANDAELAALQQALVVGAELELV